jgi:hypothetical protein
MQARHAAPQEDAECASRGHSNPEEQVHRDKGREHEGQPDPEACAVHPAFERTQGSKRRALALLPGTAPDDYLSESTGGTVKAAELYRAGAGAIRPAGAAVEGVVGLASLAAPALAADAGVPEAAWPTVNRGAAMA